MDLVDSGNESYGNANSIEDGNQGLERPRVNLKPHSHSIEQMERNTDRERLVNCLSQSLQLSKNFNSLSC